MSYCGLDVAVQSGYLYITDSQGRTKASGEFASEKRRDLRRQEGTRRESHALMTFVGWQRLLAGEYALRHLTPVLAAYFESFQALTHSIQALDSGPPSAQEDARAARLKTAPKVVRIAALTFQAAVDRVDRFPGSRKLVGYSDLAPTVRSSGERRQYGAIRRQGRAELRGVWVQTAHVVAAGIAVGVLGLFGVQSFGARTTPPAGPAVAAKPIPTSRYDLLAMSPDELAKVGIALLNLLWRRQPRAAMKRHTPR